jgi:hypothetical protein
MVNFASQVGGWWLVVGDGIRLLSAERSDRLRRGGRRPLEMEAAPSGHHR